jgi:hypothetical protein
MQGNPIDRREEGECARRLLATAVSVKQSWARLERLV